jgi:hypothetical protein
MMNFGVHHARVLSVSQRMPARTLLPRIRKPIPTPRLPSDPLRAFVMFEMGRTPAQVSLRRLVARLQKTKIPHAIMGGMAVYAHGYERFTKDVDVLLTRAGFAEFKKHFVPRYYKQVPGRPRRFLDRANGVILDCLVTGLFPGSGKPGPIAFPDPQEVGKVIKKIQYIDLQSLIQLKLAARRYQDFADVVSLIRANNLNEAYLDKLHPSVRKDFIECLEEKHREDEYEARQ